MKISAVTKKYLWLGSLLSILGFLVYLNSLTSTSTPRELSREGSGNGISVEIRFVAANELKDWIDGGKVFLLVDARRPEEYALEHIPTAVNIPYPQLAVARGELEEAGSDDPVVFYCNSVPTGRAGPCATVVRRMLQSGATEVYWFKGGMKAWRTVGHPVVGVSQERSR